MPAWLNELMTPATIGVIGALIFIGWLVYKAWPLVRNVSHLTDDMVGEKARPGVPARPGLMERMAALEEQVNTIHHETRPNGGGSMNDAVRRIERKQSVDGAALSRHIAENSIYLPMLKDLHKRYAPHETGEPPLDRQQAQPPTSPE